MRTIDPTEVLRARVGLIPVALGLNIIGGNIRTHINVLESIVASHKLIVLEFL